MGSQLGGKGFPILVPWAIVVLNVVAMMLNSMFERQREIDILSSIGLNPMHISGIFVAEASILGVAGGSIGYLLGLGLYPVMKALDWAPVISQKVSAVWLIASLGIAVISVVFGSVIALSRSVSLTPSLTRRWGLEDVD
jgi:ABC-type antimicrobial peptide transport system permease subunit